MSRGAEVVVPSLIVARAVANIDGEGVDGLARVEWIRRAIHPEAPGDARPSIAIALIDGEYPAGEVEFTMALPGGASVPQYQRIPRLKIAARHEHAEPTGRVADAANRCERERFPRIAVRAF